MIAIRCLAVLLIINRCNAIGPLVAPTLISPIHAPTLVQHENFDPHPRYSFGYDVRDLSTGDIKDQYETRDGDLVQGKYSLVEPDGTRRTVEYTADAVNGFNAVVHKEPLHHVPSGPQTVAVPPPHHIVQQPFVHHRPIVVASTPPVGLFQPSPPIPVVPAPPLVTGHPPLVPPAGLSGLNGPVVPLPTPRFPFF